MQITTFKNYGQTNYILFDGSHYALNNDFDGLYAYTESIERSGENWENVTLTFIVPDLLPVDKSALEKAIRKQESRFQKRNVTFIYKRESEKETGYTSIQKTLLTIGLVAR